MTGSHVGTLHDRLLERDLTVLRSVERYRLLTSRQIQRLHFDQFHPTAVAAARACGRTLARLRELAVLRPLERRIGGVRAGSAGFAWYVGPAGERLLRSLTGAVPRGRRNYREPSPHFVDHTLAIAELAVQVVETARRGVVEVLAVDTEPANWQQSLSPHGTVQWLKPDLRLVTATNEDEFHWFVEIDLDSEHLPVVLRQCRAYQTHRATGRYQADHGVYPLVVWATTTKRRCDQILAGITSDKWLDRALFHVVTAAQAIDLLTAGEHDFINEPGGQEGGTPS